eukprot:256764-Chlamydomonas_euryale.AAC.2
MALTAVDGAIRWRHGPRRLAPDQGPPAPLRRREKRANAIDGQCKLVGRVTTSVRREGLCAPQVGAHIRAHANELVLLLTPPGPLFSRPACKPKKQQQWRRRGRPSRRPPPKLRNPPFLAPSSVARTCSPHQAPQRSGRGASLTHPPQRTRKVGAAGRARQVAKGTEAPAGLRPTRPRGAARPCAG